MQKKYQPKLNKIVTLCQEQLKKERSSYYSELRDIKELLTEVIKMWVKDKKIEAHVRFDGFELHSKRQAEEHPGWYIAGLQVESVALYNNVGGLEKKNLWLNKLVLARHQSKQMNFYFVRSHRARTDKNFLSPLDNEFLEFFCNVMNYINERALA